MIDTVTLYQRPPLSLPSGLLFRRQLDNPKSGGILALPNQRQIQLIRTLSSEAEPTPIFHGRRSQRQVSHRRF